MGNNDRVSQALANVITALQELKDAWDEQQASFVPQVIISDAPLPPDPEFLESVKDKGGYYDAGVGVIEYSPWATFGRIVLIVRAVKKRNKE